MRLVSTKILCSRIAGADRAPENGPRFNDINPATGEVLCEVAAAGAALVVSFGLVINVYVHRDAYVGSNGESGGG